MMMCKLFYLYQLSKKVISEDFLNNYEVKTVFSSVSSLFFFLIKLMGLFLSEVSNNTTHADFESCTAFW